MNNIKVLVVDDQQSICESVAKVLARKGYSVDCSVDPEEALSKIEAVPYYLVILDIMMPKIGGVDFLKTVRQKYRECNVIMITGYASIRSAVETTQFGALAYLAKPFTPEELLDVVEKVIKENPRPAAFCEMGRFECKKFLKAGPCKDECAIKKKAKKEGRPIDVVAREEMEPIDVDMPFDFDEVEKATSPMYALTASRSDIPIIGWQRYYEKNNRILVVDDEMVVCNSIRKILDKRDYKVDYATTLEAASDNLKDKRYALVLLDIKLPDGSGMGLLKKIRSEYPETKVVIVTGYASIDNAVEATRLGAVNYLPKPFTPEELCTATDSAIGQQLAA